MRPKHVSAFLICGLLFLASAARAENPSKPVFLHDRFQAELARISEKIAAAEEDFERGDPEAALRKSGDGYSRIGAYTTELMHLIGEPMRLGLIDDLMKHADQLEDLLTRLNRIAESGFRQPWIGVFSKYGAAIPAASSGSKGLLIAIQALKEYRSCFELLDSQTQPG